MIGAEFLQLTLTPLLIGLIAAIACAIPGNFLVLRRQALLGDAISHVVLPGIVVAFLVTGTAGTLPMMLGAMAAALVSVLLIETIRRVGRVEPGAAMGVVFTSMFAAGVVLLEQSDTRNMHLDVEHALYGNLESLVWLSARDWGSLADAAALADLPPQLPRLAVVLALVVAFHVAAWKELTIATFDQAFAQSIGVPARAVSIGLVAICAMTAVAAFDAVGAIIVIAMFVCPPAAARLMTDRLITQLGWSVAFAAASAVVGFFLAGYGPLLFGFEHSVSAAGMIATVSGLILAGAVIAGPRRRGAKAAGQAATGGENRPASEPTAISPSAGRPRP
jgi:manganese/zinc/iron transport system permease protein